MAISLPIDSLPDQGTTELLATLTASLPDDRIRGKTQQAIARLIIRATELGSLEQERDQLMARYEAMDKQWHAATDIAERVPLEQAMKILDNSLGGLDRRIESVERRLWGAAL